MEAGVGGGDGAGTGLDSGGSVFCYVNSVFAPGLDEGVGGLWRVSLDTFSLFLFNLLLCVLIMIFNEAQGSCFGLIWCNFGRYTHDWSHTCLPLVFFPVRFFPFESSPPSKQPSKHASRFPVLTRSKSVSKRTISSSSGIP